MWKLVQKKNKETLWTKYIQNKIIRKIIIPRMRGAFVVCVSSFVLISCSSLPLPSSSSEFEGQSTSSSPFGQFEVPSHF